MGHMFATRLAFIENSSSNNESPILLQFFDCVFQLCRLFPKSFEFNDQLLISILDKMMSCKFGTFLGIIIFIDFI